MQNAQHWELPQGAHKIQTYICMTKSSHFPYTSTYSSMPHNANINHNIHHNPYTNIFNNARYTTNILTDTHTVTTIHIKTNMRHIHTPIVSRHLATRGNNKILRARHHTLAALKRDLSASVVVPLPNSEQINHTSSNHTQSQRQITPITNVPPL